MIYWTAKLAEKYNASVLETAPVAVCQTTPRVVPPPLGIVPRRLSPTFLGASHVATISVRRVWQVFLVP
jgi:hypothetical protein